jgi:hypothetical protein
MHGNSILDIILIPMLLPEIIIKAILIPIPGMLIRPHSPWLLPGAFWIRIFEWMEKKLDSETADAAHLSAERKAECPDYDEERDRDCVVC